MSLAETWYQDAPQGLSPAPDEIKKAIARLEPRTQVFIDGKFVPAASGKTFETKSPINGKAVARIAEGDKEDIDRAVKSARKAFNKGLWSEIAPRERKKIMLRFAELIAKNADELALLETLDMGKPIAFAKAVDVAGVVDTVRWYAEAIDKVYDEIAPTAVNALDLIRREPMGVVGAVIPWNYPLLMAAWKFAPILAAGNSLVMKPAEQSPLSLLRTVELATEAGIPAGVFNVVPGFGPTAGAALGLHMDVDAVSFTGSTEVGKYFQKYAGESNMKSVSLECGGKSPNIVFADANIDEAVMGSGFAVFFNSGQSCNASTRLMLEASIKDEFLEKLKAFASKMAPDNPLNPKTQLGTILDDVQTKRIMGYIEAGQKEGARLYAGGKQVHQATGGYYIEPTIFDNVKNSMKIAQEEIFGPVISTITFTDPNEAIEIANDTIYGLWASVWTKDINRALTLARKIRAGTVTINDTNGGDTTVPFGGYKQSGTGRDKSLHALEKYTQLKAIHIKIG
jgi:acyl-CoA reductase-like NAD-dependent aldehyde dehydrogenase